MRCWQQRYRSIIMMPSGPSVCYSVSPSPNKPNDIHWSSNWKLFFADHRTNKHAWSVQLTRPNCQQFGVLSSKTRRTIGYISELSGSFSRKSRNTPEWILFDSTMWDVLRLMTVVLVGTASHYAAYAQIFSPHVFSSDEIGVRADALSSTARGAGHVEGQQNIEVKYGEPTVAARRSLVAPRECPRCSKYSRITRHVQLRRVAGFRGGLSELQLGAPRKCCDIM